MIQLIKEGTTANVPVQEWVVDTEADISNIPEDAPFGSTAFIIAGSKVKMKTSHGTWAEI